MNSPPRASPRASCMKYHGVVMHGEGVGVRQQCLTEAPLLPHLHVARRRRCMMPGSRSAHLLPERTSAYRDQRRPQSLYCFRGLSPEAGFLLPGCVAATLQTHSVLFVVTSQARLPTASCCSNQPTARDYPPLSQRLLRVMSAADIAVAPTSFVPGSTFGATRPSAWPLHSRPLPLALRCVKCLPCRSDCGSSRTFSASEAGGPSTVSGAVLLSSITVHSQRCSDGLNGLSIDGHRG